MQIRISEHDGVPIYLQIVNQVKNLVASGRLQPEEELPSIRGLAEQLLINPNTVARAYRELEVAGIVTKKRTTGSYISASTPEMTKEERIEAIAPKVESLVLEASHLGLTSEEVAEMMRQKESELLKEKEPQ